MEDLEFKSFVVEKLQSIDSRLESLESGLDGISNFASGMLGGDEEGLFNQESLEALKGTLTSLAAPLSSLGQVPDMDPNSSPEDIISSLNEFKDRLSGIRSFMETEMQNETVNQE